MPERQANTVMMDIANISLDPAVQIRDQIHYATVDRYAERMIAGDEFPPVLLFGTRATAWIADGWHRVLAARKNGATHVAARILRGVSTDALRYAATLHEHALERSEADLARAGLLTSGTSAPEPTLSAAAVADALDNKFAEFPAVDHRPARCPNCGSSRSWTRGIRHFVPSVAFRYHVCKKCSTRFRSTQELTPVDAADYQDTDGE